MCIKNRWFLLIRRALRGTQVASAAPKKAVPPQCRRNVWSSGNNTYVGGGAAGLHPINVPTVGNDVVFPHARHRVTEPGPICDGRRGCGGVSARQAAVETDCNRHLEPQRAAGACLSRPSLRRSGDFSRSHHVIHVTFTLYVLVSTFRTGSLFRDR